MSKKRSKPRKPPADTPPPTTEPEVSSAPEAQFSSNLSPVLGCPPSVLDRSRIELYGGLILSVILQAVPMTATTRSLFFLVVLAAFIDLSWRSSWMHYRKATSKIVGTVIVCVLYLVLVVAMFFNESESFRASLLAVLHSQKFFYFLFLIIGSTATLLGLKTTSLIRGYLQAKKAEQLAVRERFQATHKGWLDYRMGSEDSSQRVHAVSARLFQQIGRVSKGIIIASWFLKRKPSVTSLDTWVLLVVPLMNRSSAGIERNLEELRLSAEAFTENTEGHLKVCKQNYGKLENAREYFEFQLKEIREAANTLAGLPKALQDFRGLSQNLTAAINRMSACMRTWNETLRKLEGHCARMVKLAETRRDRVIDRQIVRPLKQINSSLITIVEKMAETEDSDELREQAHHLREMEKQVEAGQQPDTTWIDQKHQEIEARSRSSSMISSSEIPETRE
jgi:hypothetical protein